ncbi:gas vesicle protein [Candidatus Bipolaricaulota bacterium]|nr:gas vesicle protein [Candidatus Bipolaricaulota bacterium]
MEPERDELIDLLDRILEKGVILNADLIIGIGEIPLIGLDLRLALAGIKTMLDYGLWEDWDKAHRAVASQREEG